MTKTTTKIPLYGGKLRIIQTESFVDIAKQKGFNKQFINSEAAVFHEDDDGLLQCFVVFKTGDVSNKIIAHEALHVVSIIFDHIGAKMDLDNDEPQAYLLGWVVEQCDKTLNKL